MQAVEIAVVVGVNQVDASPGHSFQFQIRFGEFIHADREVGLSPGRDRFLLNDRQYSQTEICRNIEPFRCRKYTSVIIVLLFLA